MSATQTLVAPLPPPILTQEVIDVDALEDDGGDEIVWSGFRRATNTASPRRVVDRLAEDGHASLGFPVSSTSPNGGRRSHASGGVQAGPPRAICDDVIILESDDKGGPSSSLSRPSQSSRPRVRFVSPPRPRTEGGNTRAVPVLRRHLATRSALPKRRQRPDDQVPNLSPSIRRRADPLPFETRIASLPQLPPRNTAQRFGAAPTSHHHPAMGFGGAILALNRQRAVEEANRQGRDARSNTFNLPSFTEMFRRMTGPLANSGARQGAAAGVSSGRMRWQRPWEFNEPDREISHNLNFSPDIGEDGMLHPLGGPYRLSRDKQVHWRPKYTHPEEKAVPGFTHDFAPVKGDQSPASGSASPIIVLDEDEAGPSQAGSSSATATAVETILVCARCLDPLVLAAPHGASEGQRKKSRIWALRCGHMLDGKCIAELYAPPPPTSVVEEEPVKGKGKGKAKADPDVDADASPAEPLATAQSDEPTPSVTDKKGKRKAVEPPEEESPAPSPSKRTRFAEPAESESNPIRSRWRSHTRLAAVPDTAPPEAAYAATDPQPPPIRRNRRSGPSGSGAARGNGKGKGKAREMKKPAIEAEHEWVCPVRGCGRVHYGVRVQGEWKNDEGRGAITLFV